MLVKCSPKDHSSEVSSKQQCFTIGNQYGSKTIYNFLPVYFISILFYKLQYLYITQTQSMRIYADDKLKMQRIKEEA